MESVLTPEEFAEEIVAALPYEPTGQQWLAAEALARFCRVGASPDSVFLLCGYAGTGKTTLVSALVEALHSVNIATVLMAPTGRAAKVFAAYADYPASTIHRKIYYPPGLGKPFSAVMDNPHHDTMFIVDEASMIGTDSGTDLLSDLIHYVYSGQNCRMILLGDTAQLPPVGCKDSPALMPDVLRSYGLRVSRVQLTHTVRQTSSSGILFNATALRKQMRLPKLERPYLSFDFDDVRAVTSDEVEDIISSRYGADGVDETILITRSNWRANAFNQAIRARILDREEELCRGELLLVAKNNYHWAAKLKELDFIANGDTATVTRIHGTEEKYGFRFADVVLEFPYRQVEVPCKIILQCLTSDAPALTAEQQEQLFQAVYNDPELFTEYTPHIARMRALKTNPYFQALQVKYAYAVTCHKAQGGQWRNVIVDLGNVKPESLLELDFHRWLYTATTRATTALYYLNPF